MAAERRDRLLGGFLVGFLVVDNDLLLRIAVRQLVANQQRRSRKTHAFRSGACELDEALRGNTVTLIQRRSGHAELRIVARNDRRALTEAWIDDGLNAGHALDLGELRGHVTVARTVGFFGRNGDSVVRCDLDALSAHRRTKAVGA